MPFRPLLAFAALGLSAGSAATSSAATPAPASCPSDPQLAELIAASDVVLIGAMDVPRQRIAEERQKPAPGYVDAPIRIDRVLKGDATQTATVRINPRDTSYQPATDTVLGLANAPALLFLTRGDGTPGLYFAGDTPAALQSATDPTTAAAQAETARQAQLLRAWHADPTLPHFAEVQALIAQLGDVGGTSQQRIFNRLEALGIAAVPAIVAQMDDRRPLKTPAITLRNTPDSFEAARQYGPEQVVDGLAAVLNQITGANFGSIENGGSDSARDAAVAGWRVYASSLGCKAPS